MGLLKRNMYFCSEEAKEQAYFSPVRPHVEYACSLWDPSAKGLINKLEAVQRRGVRFVTSNNIREEGIVTGLLKKRYWLSLEDRRRVSRLAFMYKMFTNKVFLNFDDHFQLKT